MYVKRQRKSLLPRPFLKVKKVPLLVLLYLVYSEKGPVKIFLPNGRPKSYFKSYFLKILQHMLAKTFLWVENSVLKLPISTFQSSSNVSIAYWSFHHKFPLFVQNLDACFPWQPIASPTHTKNMTEITTAHSPSNLTWTGTKHKMAASWKEENCLIFTMLLRPSIF